ncbi:universal stress protein [Candidatus Synechococcus calcipolaris G9]|uniref:Universal stress protein n=1 Tax=Candidatus Synechococcus calcipolaris G9 TaxID=1497997 RepID=A0ABT6F3E9_9SYNE|nr:universal stress protein [Candidatus Synechococcus calcipolaris]MDG2992391.1 universal stress protein [Candidatus Synechococcus calcipolaris G9]
MKKILICTDGSSFAENSYRYGAWFAHRLDATIHVLCVTDIRSQQVISTGNLSGSIGIDASENLLHRLVELEHEKAKVNNQRAKLILQQANQALQGEGIHQVQLFHETGFLVDCFEKFEADSDLVVLGKRGENASFASGHLGANLERILRSSHKPCLVTSRQFTPIERVLIAYDGSPTAKKMLQFVTQSQLFHDIDLHVITIGKGNQDGMAIARLSEAETSLSAAGLKAIYQLLQGESEKEISRYSSQQDICLLIMGAYGHSRIRHLVIGSTTAQILRSSHIPVLVFR